MYGMPLSQVSSTESTESIDKSTSQKEIKTEKGEALTDEKVWKYFEEKLKLLPVKNIKAVEKPLKNWWNSVAQSNGQPIKGQDSLMGYFLGEKGGRVRSNAIELKKKGEPVGFVYGHGSANQVKRKHVDADFENIDFDSWNNTKKNMNGTEYKEVGSKYVMGCKAAFGSLRGPDCVKAFTDGYAEACKIRRQEGYIINNTLSQMTKDIKRISKIAIKEKIEKSREGDFPCLYADTIDKYDTYATSTNPLMDWYDIVEDKISNPNLEEQDFGMILSAMCLLKDKNPTNWKGEKGKKAKLNFLKEFKFIMCTVLNETYIMNFGGNEATTPAGNYIYVNNPPLPPFINVGKLENSFKEYIFYENDPRRPEPFSENDKKYQAFLNLYNDHLNILVKMFKHPNYEEQAIKLMQGIAEAQGAKPNFIFFDKDSIKKNFTDPAIIKYLKDYTQTTLDIIKKNNNATYIGTIQTTEEVNRISEKIIISEEVNTEKNLSSIDPDNINVKLLKKLFSSCVLYDDSKLPAPFPGGRIFAGKKKELSAMLYECLYEINKVYRDEKMLKPCKDMKERDIEAMVNSIETVFPIMTRYIDPQKIQIIWEIISTLERGQTVIQNKTYGMFDRADKARYPYAFDKICPGGYPSTGSLEDKKLPDNTVDNFKKFITSAVKSAKSPLLLWNQVIAGILKNEPGIPYLTDGPWIVEKRKAENYSIPEPCLIIKSHRNNKWNMEDGNWEKGNKGELKTHGDFVCQPLGGTGGRDPIGSIHETLKEKFGKNGILDLAKSKLADQEPWGGPIETINRYDYKKGEGEKAKIKKQRFKYKTYPGLKDFYNAIGFKTNKRKKPLMPFFTTRSFFENAYGAYQALSFNDPNEWKSSGFGEFKAVRQSQVKKLMKGTSKIEQNLPVTTRCGKATYPPKQLTADELAEKKLVENNKQPQEIKKKTSRHRYGGYKKVTRRKKKKVKRKQTRRKK